MRLTAVIAVVVLCLGSTSIITAQLTYNNWDTAFTTPYQPYARQFTVAVAIDSNFVIVFGGFNYSCACSMNDAWLWRANISAWKSLLPVPADNPLPAPRAGHTGVAWNSTMVIFGGAELEGENQPVLIFGDLWAVTVEVNLVTMVIAGARWTRIVPTSEIAPVNRTFHSAVLYDTTTMAVFGGESTTGAYLDDCWFFNFTIRDWSQLNRDASASWPQPRKLQVTAVSGAMMFIAGGLTASPSSPSRTIVLNDIWVLNMTNGIWTQLPSLNAGAMDSPFAFVGATWVMSTSQLIIMGGFYDSINLEIVSFNTSSGNWSFVMSSGAPLNRVGFSLTSPLGNDLIYMFGGFIEGGESLPTPEIWSFDLEETFWQPVSPPYQPQQREFHVLVQLSEGMFTFGGSQTQGPINCLGDSWILDDNYRWRELAPPVSPPPRRAMAFAVYDDVLFMFGGWGLNGPLNDTWSFDLTVGWVPLPVTVSPPGVSGCSGAMVVNPQQGPRMVVFGGGTRLSRLSSQTWELSFLSQPNWKLINPATSPPPRLGHSMMSIGDGQQILLFGGQSIVDFVEILFSDLWSYNGNTNQWSLVTIRSNSAPANRSWCAAASQGIRAFIFGGRGASGVLYNDLWMFDWLQSTWVLLPAGDPVLPIAGMLAVFSNQTMFSFGGPGPFAGTLEIILGCPLGYTSPSFYQQSCIPCPIGSYADGPGRSVCEYCPALLTTNQVASNDSIDCRMCAPGSCNGHGTCDVRGGGGIVCTCDFGYLSNDFCKTPTVYLSIFGILVFAILFIIVVVALKRSKRHKFQRKLYERLLDDAKEEVIVQKEEVATLERAWRIDEADLEFLNLLDSGAFGEVHAAIWSGRKVAVKILKQAVMEVDSQAEAEFEREVKFLRTVRHPNLVLFFGFGYKNATPFLVAEFMARGSLSKILYDTSVDLEWEMRMRFALDAAKGMKFLHSLKPPVVHRDLKSANLLVSSAWTLKVSDFGTARIIQNCCSTKTQPVVPPSRSARKLVDMSMGVTTPPSQPSCPSERLLTRGVGTLLWQAPEIISGGQNYGTEADVFSYAIVLWEILCRAIPYQDLENLWDVENAVVRGERPSIPPGTNFGYSMLMQECWDADISRRPSFHDITTRLEKLEVEMHCEQCDDKMVVCPSKKQRNVTFISQFSVET